VGATARGERLSWALTSYLALTKLFT
jgi:hypothetical protein